MNNSTTSKKKRKKNTLDETVRKGFKRSAGFTWGLLVNVIIVYIVIKIFSYSFNFAYSMFGDVCKDPGDTTYVTVDIPEDSSVIQIGQALEDAGIIEDKYVFWGKVKIRGYASKIIPGKYALSASMNYDDILIRICNIKVETEEE
ncbi:MAG: endolytic transglycosylase MltG [Wujia sp.]